MDVKFLSQQTDFFSNGSPFIPFLKKLACENIAADISCKPAFNHLRKKSEIFENAILTDIYFSGDFAIKKLWR